MRKLKIIVVLGCVNKNCLKMSLDDINKEIKSVKVSIIKQEGKQFSHKKFIILYVVWTSDVAKTNLQTSSDCWLVFFVKVMIY